MTKTLKSFAQKQAAEEKKETQTPAPAEQAPADTTADETEGESEEETDETEVTEEEADETEGESEEETPAPAASASLAGALPPGHVGVNAADLKLIQEKAGKWDAAETEYNTLKSWYANTVQIGAAAKEDISNARERQKPSSVASQPWNAKAIKIAESL